MQKEYERIKHQLYPIGDRSSLRLYYFLSRKYMIHAYKEDNEDYDWDGSDSKFFSKHRFQSDNDREALAPKIIDRWMKSKFARQKVAPYVWPGDPFPPSCPKFSAWRMQNPLPPYDNSHVKIDEGLVYWDPSFKMSKEEAKEQWDKLMQEYEEDKRENDEWHPP